ncbi:MAG: GGDEF domain-containing protein [Spirochaetota bacterium]
MNAIARLTVRMERIHGAAAIAIALPFIVLLGYLDHFTGPELAFSLFYLFPILFIVFSRGGFLFAIGASFVCALAWGVADVTSGHVYAAPWMLFWNTVIRLAYFVIISVISAQFKAVLMREAMLARTDELTGLSNMRVFREAAASETARLTRYGHAFTFAFMDIDNFKEVNDRFGHNRGDDVLRDVARIMRHELRVNDIAARAGGDEFCILFPETGTDVALATLKKLSKSIMRVIRGKRFPVTLSIGAVTFEKPPASVDEMLRLGDGLMYTVKYAGKNDIACRTVK